MKPISKLLALSAASLLTLGAAHAQVLFVSQDNGTIGDYNADGSAINSTLVTGLASPQAIFATGNELIATERDNDKIDVYTLSAGDTVATLATTLTGSGTFQYGVTVVGSTIYVASFQNNDINEFTLGGTLIGTLTAANGLNGPVQLATDGTNLFAGEISGSGAVVEFTAAQLALATPTAATVESGTSSYGLTVSGGTVYGGGPLFSVPVSGGSVTSLDASVSGDGEAVLGTNLYESQFSASGVLEFTLTGTPENGGANIITPTGGGVTDVFAEAATPEPSSWAMLLGGFGALAAIMRARRTVA